MNVILHEGDSFVLRFDRGEDVIAELKKFCQEHSIQAGSLMALGATGEVELAHYDAEVQKYSNRVFTEKLEIASFVGNVSVFEGDVVVHAHGVFSDTAMRTYAGHINRMIVAATCEMTLRQFDGVIEREHDDVTGLNLMKQDENGI